MDRPLPWTEDQLAAMAREIDEFAQAAFAGSVNRPERVKRMTFIARNCADENVASILGRSTGYLAAHPDWVRRDIGLARQHVELLKNRIAS